LPIAVRVKDVAKPKIISLDRDRSAWEAIGLMFDYDIGSVVITSSGRPAGIVTERDILRRVVHASLDSKSVKAGQVMSSPLITIPATASLGDAAALMVEKKIRRLLVVENSVITGIFTQRDLQSKTLDTFFTLSQV
jgi:CBS domain-containing protein